MTLQPLPGTQHRAGLIVIKDEGPEVLRWHVRWQVHLVGLPTVERLPLRVGRRHGVLRSDADAFGDHRLIARNKAVTLRMVRLHSLQWTGPIPRRRPTAARFFRSSQEEPVADTPSVDRCKVPCCERPARP